MSGAPTQVPIVQSVSFGYGDLTDWQEVALGRREGHIYSLNTNPTAQAFEEKVRLLEGAEAATSFAYWMDSASFAAKGIPSVIYGPTPHDIHGLAERVNVSEVRQLERVLLAAAKRFCQLHPD